MAFNRMYYGVLVIFALAVMQGAAAADDCKDGDVVVESKSLGIVTRLITHNNCGCAVNSIVAECPGLNEQRLAKPEIITLIGDGSCILYISRLLPPHSETNDFYGGDPIAFKVITFNTHC